MKEAKGNIWEAKPNFVRCITTNGVVKENGELVMGKGIALEAKKRYPQLPHLLGNAIKNNGNKVYYIKEFNIATFPTKHHWKDKSNIELIIKSCYELNSLLIDIDKSAVLPRPGCGNGKLSWENEVKPIISKILSDRVWIITK